MKPDWDKLGDEFFEHQSVLIGDVDCTVEKELCSKYGIKGFPTLKVFNDGSEEAYEGGRDYTSLKKFADENLGPSCNSLNKDLCTAEQLATLEEMEALGEEEIKARISASELAASAATAKFELALKNLQERYEQLSAEKDAELELANKPLKMLRKIKFA